jgi:hypothetical protein
VEQEKAELNDHFLTKEELEVGKTDSFKLPPIKECFGQFSMFENVRTDPINWNYIGNPLQNPLMQQMYAYPYS